jgi:hypothetical protein
MTGGDATGAAATRVSAGSSEFVIDDPNTADYRGKPEPGAFRWWLHAPAVLQIFKVRTEGV